MKIRKVKYKELINDLNFTIFLGVCCKMAIEDMVKRHELSN